MDSQFKIFPIGFIRKKDDISWIEIDDEYSDALLGLDGFSHIQSMKLMQWINLQLSILNATFRVLVLLRT